MLDILSTVDDDRKTQRGGVHVLADVILRYAPGCDKWEDRKEMLEQLEKDMPHERPLRTQKNDTRPLGVFDVRAQRKGLSLF